MRGETRDVRLGLERTLRTLPGANEYHRESIPRYSKTISLARTHWIFDRETSVAELGPGLILPYLKSVHACDTTAYGLSDQPWAASLAASGFPVVHWDLNLPVPTQHGKQHDFIFFCEVVEHLNRWPIEVLSDIRCLLQPGGLLLLTTVNIVRASNRFRVLFGRSPLINPFQRTADGTNHVREYALEEVVSYLEEAGFEVVDQRRWAFYPPSPAGRVCSVLSWLFPRTANYFAIVARNPQSTR